MYTLFDAVKNRKTKKKIGNYFYKDRITGFVSLNVLAIADFICHHDNIQYVDMYYFI